jgi:hypothetical protein
MNPVVLFLVGVGVSAVLAIGVVWYLKPHLHAVLVDLCGTEVRAAFWTAFSTVAVVLTPIMFALHYRPDVGTNARAIFEIGTQLEWALGGLLMSVLLLAIVLARFIPTSKPLNHA